MHTDSKADEKTLAKKIADASGGKYTVQQIEDQMALMNMTVDGQTYIGSNQVASGAQPQDGTTWVPYGTNLAGQQVWAQSLSPGNADIQNFIAQNANAQSGSTGITYQPTTKQYTQYSVSGSGTVMLPLVGGGLGVNVGISTDRTLGGTSPYIQFQGNAMASAGAYAGVGASFGASYTNGPLTSGTGKSGYAELDAGFGDAGGANLSINDDGTIGGGGGSGPAKAIPGVGFGAGIGAGVSYTTTIVLPSLNDILRRKR